MNPERRLVTIGMVTWNSATDLVACFDGLDRQRYPNLELIVVDNGSTDRSVELVRRRWPSARVIENGRNEGFCRAHNAAIRVSQGEYYLALNPDVSLLPGFVDALVSALEAHPRCGSATGKLLQALPKHPAWIDSVGLMLDRSRHQYLRGRGEADQGRFDAPCEVFGADGAAPLYRRSMLEDVKVLGEYFDEAFFAYMEDVDLAWRARLLGWSAWYEPKAVAYHVRTFQPGRRRGMSAEMRRMAVRNRYLMLLKNEGREEFRRDWWRICRYELGIWTYVLFVERSSLGAIRMLRKQWDRTIASRNVIWSKVRAEPVERLLWFR